jgi:hypothetical protein
MVPVELCSTATPASYPMANPRSHSHYASKTVPHLLSCAARPHQHRPSPAPTGHGPRSALSHPACSVRSHNSEVIQEHTSIKQGSFRSHLTTQMKPCQQHLGRMATQTTRLGVPGEVKSREAQPSELARTTGPHYITRGVNVGSPTQR